jgi:hypothetical protein
MLTSRCRLQLGGRPDQFLRCQAFAERHAWPRSSPTSCGAEPAAAVARGGAAASRLTHLKVVAVALVFATLVVGIGFAARVTDVLDDPQLNKALGLPQNSQMTFRRSRF